MGFVAGTPYALLSWDEFRRGVLGQVEDYGGITHGDFTDPWNWRGYLGFFLGEGLGWIACAALLLGLALLLWRRRAVALIWLSFVIPYLLLHMAQASHFNRNMLPVVVLGALPIGIAGGWLVQNKWLGPGGEPRTKNREPGREQRTKNREQTAGEPNKNREPGREQRTKNKEQMAGEPGGEPRTKNREPGREQRTKNKEQPAAEPRTKNREPGRERRNKNGRRTERTTDDGRRTPVDTRSSAHPLPLGRSG